MKDASQYPITFPYGAQDGKYYGPNGSVGLYHRGNDRACPIGTPIVINGQTIGLTGSTGLSGGPHLHTQGARPGGYDDFNPTAYEFKPGKVVDAGVHYQFGNYIRVRVNSSVDIIYAHLSKISVKVGDKIGEETEEMLKNKNHLKALTRQFLGKDPSKDLQKYIGKPYAYAVDKLHKARIDLPTVLKQNAKLKAENASLKKDAGEFNAIGKALVELIAKFGYKKG